MINRRVNIKEMFHVWKMTMGRRRVKPRDLVYLFDQYNLRVYAVRRCITYDSRWIFMVRRRFPGFVIVARRWRHFRTAAAARALAPTNWHTHTHTHPRARARARIQRTRTPNRAHTHSHTLEKKKTAAATTLSCVFHTEDTDWHTTRHKHRVFWWNIFFYTYIMTTTKTIKRLKHVRQDVSFGRNWRAVL